MAKFNFTGSYIRAGSSGQKKDDVLALSKHPNPAVRRRLAENSEIHGSILAKLARDPEPEVRAGLAWNKSIHESILLLLCQDEDVNVRLSLTENHLLPEAVLAALERDENPYVQHAAIRARQVSELEKNLASQNYSSKSGTEAKLGELMVEAGFLEETIVNGLIEIARRKRMPLGHVLIWDGGMDKAVVERALLLQDAVRINEITVTEALKQLKDMKAAEVALNTDIRKSG